MAVLSSSTDAPCEPIGELLKRAWAQGIELSYEGGQLLVLADRYQEDVVQALGRRKGELVPLLIPGPGREVVVGNQPVPYRVWSGEQLGGSVAMDTETELIRDHAVPRLALASACNGQCAYLIHPHDIHRFVVVHAEAKLCFHNVGFDFWVLHQHLAGQSHAQRMLWQMVDTGRMRDSMLLHALYRLALNDEYPKNRDLGALAQIYAGVVIDKSDPFRLRYAEIIDKDWSMVSRGYFEYAVRDAIATGLIYAELARRVRALIAKWSVTQATIEQYGMLSEAIQVKAAIALAAVERNGLQVDRRHLHGLHSGLGCSSGGMSRRAQRSCVAW